VNDMADEGISDTELAREQMREVAEWAKRRGRGSVAGSMELVIGDGVGTSDNRPGHREKWDVGRQILKGEDVLEMEKRKEQEKEKELERSSRMLDGDGVVVVTVDESPNTAETGDPMQLTTNVGPFTFPSSLFTPGPVFSLSSYLPWFNAQRRALLTRNRLTHTEQHYHPLLSALVTHGTTATPPPALMRECATKLIRVSNSVLKRMERETSAQGVDQAFLDKVAEVEEPYEEVRQKSMHSIPREKEKGKNSNPTPVSFKRPAVRGLAIRYVSSLLFSSLLSYTDALDHLIHTPLRSSSRPPIEQAVDAIYRIADKCVRA